MSAILFRTSEKLALIINYFFIFLSLAYPIQKMKSFYPEKQKYNFLFIVLESFVLRTSVHCAKFPLFVIFYGIPFSFITILSFNGNLFVFFSKASAICLSTMRWRLSKWKSIGIIIFSDVYQQKNNKTKKNTCAKISVV